LPHHELIESCASCFHCHPSTKTIPMQKGYSVNLAVSNNYRGIALALSPIFVKIFDNIVLMRYHTQHVDNLRVTVWI